MASTSRALPASRTTNVAAAHALARLTSPSALSIDDRPIISFLAHRRVVGQVVDLAFLRFETGSLTDAKVIALPAPAPRRRHLPRRSLARGRVLAYVRTHYRRRYDAGGMQI